MTKNQNHRPVWVIWILKFGQAVTRDTMGNGGCDLLPPGLLSGTKHLFDFSGIITVSPIYDKGRRDNHAGMASFYPLDQHQFGIGGGAGVNHAAKFGFDVGRLHLDQNLGHSFSRVNGGEFTAGS